MRRPKPNSMNERTLSSKLYQASKHTNNKRVGKKTAHKFEGKTRKNRNEMKILYMSISLWC